jgi:hypothetical protein
VPVEREIEATAFNMPALDSSLLRVSIPRFVYVVVNEKTGMYPGWEGRSK